MQLLFVWKIGGARRRNVVAFSSTTASDPLNHQPFFWIYSHSQVDKHMKGMA
jgi:hypothetical protein